MLARQLLDETPIRHGEEGPGAETTAPGDVSAGVLKRFGIFGDEALKDGGGGVALGEGGGEAAGVGGEGVVGLGGDEGGGGVLLGEVGGCGDCLECGVLVGMGLSGRLWLAGG